MGKHVKNRKRLRVEVDFIIIIIIFLSFSVAFNDTLNKCSVFISFRSLYEHLPDHFSVSVKSRVRSPHPVRTCAAHRFFAGFSMFSFLVAESSLNLYLLI